MFLNSARARMVLSLLAAMFVMFFLCSAIGGGVALLLQFRFYPQSAHPMLAPAILAGFLGTLGALAVRASVRDASEHLGSEQLGEFY